MAFSKIYLYLLFAAAGGVLGMTCGEPVAFAKSEIDYRVYGTLLKKHVSSGQVDYVRWKKKDIDVFERYIKGLADISIHGVDPDAEKAFWINAYNAVTLYGVLKRIPENALLARFFSVQIVPGFFSKEKYDIAGESLTLDDIEHKKLRARFKDPRIHFVIVCASTSCPALQNRVYDPVGLDKRLDEAARLFARDKTRNRLDKKKGILYLSSLFDWYKGDFEKDSTSITNYVLKYISREDSDYIRNNDPRVKYLFYDWMVNIKK